MAAPLPFPTEHPDPPRAPKSVGLAVLLAVLFGPFGLFYASVGGALFMLFLMVVVGLFTVGLGLVPAWLMCIGWAYAAAVHSRNEAERPGG